MTRNGIVTCHPLGRTLEVRAGETLLDAALREHLPLASSCAGHAVCGDCAVRVLSGAVPEPDGDELAWMGRNGAAPPVRLACRLRPKGPTEVSTTYW